MEGFCRTPAVAAAAVVFGWAQMPRFASPASAVAATAAAAPHGPAVPSLDLVWQL